MKILNFFKKVGSLILIYGIFLFVFYSPFFLISESYIIKHNLTISSLSFSIYIFVIIPLISLLIPKYLIKKFNFNKYFIWIFDILIIYLSSIYFFVYIISSAFQNFG